jgi:spore maturation protein CgeB
MNERERMMTPAPLHIAVITTDPAITRNRGAFIRALRQVGHRVEVVTIGKAVSEGTRKTLESGRFPGGYEPDLLLFFCIAYVRVHLAGWLRSLLDHFPYVTLWDSNPLRALHFLQQAAQNHVGLFVFDSQIVEDLQALGFEQAVYCPYYYADPSLFRLLPPAEAFRHDVSFAGTLYRPTKEDRLLVGEDRVVWSAEMTRIVQEFVELRRMSKRYVVVYRYLAGHVDVWSRECLELSNHLMYLQKWSEREELFAKLDRAELDCHVYGGNTQMAGSEAGHQRMLPDGRHLHLHEFLDKHRALPVLCNSTSVNLCCTRFPRACHERVYQAAGCGAFLLHAWKADVPALFEPDKEIVMYREIEEVPDLIRFSLGHERKRRTITERARSRFLKDHVPARRAAAFSEVVPGMTARYQDRQAAVA